MKILLIDDDLGTRETMSVGLRKLGGHVVATAATGEAGLAMAEAASNDVVLIDLVLPDMSGLDVLRGLTCTTSAGAVKYLMTGYASVATAVDAMKLGAIDYLPKPVDIDVLLRAFQSDESAPGDRDSAVTDRRIADILRLIANDPMTDVAALAKAVELSESRLRHLFHEIVGTALGRFLHDAKLDVAADLLVHTHERVCQIGYRCGFPDGGHFIKCFRERFGMPPARYRRLRGASADSRRVS